jgi:nitroreductase
VNPDEIDRVIRTRRTSMQVHRDRPIPRDVVQTLCELAMWAPNHKRTWPWRFALIEGEGRARLGDVIADGMAAYGDAPEKVAKARGKYLRTPATLVVGSAPGDTTDRTAENRDATAAGIQNLMLAATARGLATYWGSCPKGANEVVASLCGFEDGTHVAAIIYLGWATDDEVAVPERPSALLTVVD